MFTEYGAIDLVEAPHDPADTRRAYDLLEYADSNNNGVEDGRETQANIFQALFETMDDHPGVVHGAFFWDNWIASDELWARDILEDRRNFDIRNKPAGKVVRAQYEKWRSAEGARVTAAGTLPNRTLHAGTVAVAVAVPVGDAFRNASTYQASSSAPGVATVRVSGSTVTVTSVAEGVATIAVTASGADGSTATQRFGVTVLASTASRPSQFLELRRRIETLRRREGRR